MKIRGYKHSVSVLMIGVLCLGVFKIVVTHMFAVNDFNIVIDPIIADDIQTKIQQYINDSATTHAMQSIMHAICDQYPCIKSISCSYNIPHLAVLEIIARFPSYAVNGTHIITDDGRWVERSLYNAYATERLIVVTIPHSSVQEQAIQQKVNTALNQIPSTFFTHYAMCIHNEMGFCLHDKQDTTFSIVFNHKSVPDNACLHSCEIIKETLKKREDFAKKHWNADVRFENQIIVSVSGVASKRSLDCEKGGYHDGSRIF